MFGVHAEGTQCVDHLDDEGAVVILHERHLGVDQAFQQRWVANTEGPGIAVFNSPGQDPVGAGVVATGHRVVQNCLRVHRLFEE